MLLRNVYSQAKTLLGVITSKRNALDEQHRDGSANTAVRLGVDDAGSWALDWSCNLRL